VKTALVITGIVTICLSLPVNLCTWAHWRHSARPIRAVLYRAMDLSVPAKLAVTTMICQKLRLINSARAADRAGGLCFALARLSTSIPSFPEIIVTEPIRATAASTIARADRSRIRRRDKTGYARRPATRRIRNKKRSSDGRVIV